MNKIRKINKPELLAPAGLPAKALRFQNGKQIKTYNRSKQGRPELLAPAGLPAKASRFQNGKQIKTYNRSKQGRPELLAPAGNLEKMKTAFAFGADAVYAGIPDFSLRVRVNDFNIKSLGEAIQYAHKLKKKVYVTVNIFAYNEHIKKLPAHIKKLKQIKPDGIFISDPGVMEVVKKEWPKANIILSTQANCTNWRSAKFWQDQGMKRIILARDISLADVKEIRKKLSKLELETFVHGALCMAYSGRCFISKQMTGRNANLGDCAQPCRWNYNVFSSSAFPVIPARFAVASARRAKAGIQELSQEGDFCFLLKTDGRSGTLELREERHGSYILNSHDLCLIKRVPELIDAGISAFKIEGRAKSVYYLGCVVGAYRRAIDVYFNKKINKKNKIKILAKLYKELEEKLFHRGYTEGFMFGQGEGAQNLDNSHKMPDWEFCGQIVLPPLHPSPARSSRERGAYVRVHNTLKVGDQIEIIEPGYDIIKMKLKKMIDAKTGEKLKEAHGGQSAVVIIGTSQSAAEYSVLRRKIKTK